MDTGKTSYQSKYHRAKWRMLLATMFCYLFYYTGRQNWGWAVKALIDELGFSAQMTGTIAGAMLGAYGIGQLINGNLGDKYGGRRLMSLGAILSCVMCWITSFGGSFFSILIPWTANGYVQSLGWAPGSRLISNWWGYNERAKAFGFYMFAAGFSAVRCFCCPTSVAPKFTILRRDDLGSRAPVRPDAAVQGWFCNLGFTGRACATRRQ